MPISTEVSASAASGVGQRAGMQPRAARRPWPARSPPRGPSGRRRTPARRSRSRSSRLQLVGGDVVEGRHHARAVPRAASARRAPRSPRAAAARAPPCGGTSGTVVSTTSLPATCGLISSRIGAWLAHGTVTKHDLAGLGGVGVGAPRGRGAPGLQWQRLRGGLGLVGRARADDDRIAGSGQPAREPGAQRAGAADDRERRLGPAATRALPTASSRSAARRRCRPLPAPCGCRAPPPRRSPRRRARTACRTLTLTRLPLMATISPSRTMRSACSPRPSGP